MIRFYLKWIIIQLKSTFKHVAFYLMTLLTTIILIATDAVIKETDEDIEVLICTGKTGIGEYVFEYLNACSISGYSFIRAEDENEVKDSVAKSEVACGVIFSGSADEDVLNILGITEADTKKKKHAPVSIYQNADMPEGYLVQEILFPVIQRGVSDDWLAKYLPSQAEADSLEKYNALLDAMKLNLSEVIYVDKTSVIYNKKPAVNPHRITISVCIALICLMTAFGIADQRRSDLGFYNSFPVGKHILLKIIKISVTTMVSATVSICIYLLYLNLIK